MKKVFPLFYFLSAIYIVTFLNSCANIIPPGGGPKDTLPPQLLASNPKDSQLNFIAKKIILTYNEFVEIKDVQQNFIVNPLPQNMPTLDYKLNHVWVNLKDSLEPNTTYTLNFGNSIRDVNEGNIAQHKTYVFSTGSRIDNNNIKGKVILAKEAKPDTNLIVVLHANLADTAVLKLRPKYLTKLDGQGNFTFTNLPKATFNLFVLPNDYSKKYDDSTKAFGFLNQSINTESPPENIVVYAYKEFEVVQANKPAQQVETKTKDDKKLRYSTNLINNKFDLLDTMLQLEFSKKILLKYKDSIFLTDTNYMPLKDYAILWDSSNNKIKVQHNFMLNNAYYLLLAKNAVSDTLGNLLNKNDTIKFNTLKEDDYGSLKLQCSKTDTNAVLLIYKNDKLEASITLNKKMIEQKIFKPGEYDLRVLLDENKNRVWDAGSYKQKRQPEKVVALKNKLIVKSGWKNEAEISW